MVEKNLENYYTKSAVCFAFIYGGGLIIFYN